MVCVTVPDWYHFRFFHICCFCGITCPYDGHQGRLLQREQDEKPELSLYTCRTGQCVQVRASLFCRQPPKGWEDKVHSGWTSGEIYLCKVLLNIRTDSPWSGWSHHPQKCSRNNCMWHSVPWSSRQGGDHSMTSEVFQNLSDSVAHWQITANFSKQDG